MKVKELALILHRLRRKGLGDSELTIDYNGEPSEVICGNEGDLCQVLKEGVKVNILSKNAARKRFMHLYNSGCMSGSLNVGMGSSLNES